jgi:hypothetical protein
MAKEAAWLNSFRIPCVVRRVRIKSTRCWTERLAQQDSFGLESAQAQTKGAPHCNAWAFVAFGLFQTQTQSDSCSLDWAFVSRLKIERGQCAAPRTPRAQRYVMQGSLGPQANVCDDFRHACDFISHVWSPFHGCGSSKQFSA